MTTISVLIPAFNAENYIQAAIESVMAQTEFDLEILVIDDCSTDTTADLVTRMIQLDSRIRLLRTDQNGGPAAARNVGLRAAKSEWIALLDADDCYRPERLERLLALARQTQADMVADNVGLWESGPIDACKPMLSSAVLYEPRLIDITTFIEGNADDSRTTRISYGFFKPIIRRAFLQQHQLMYDEANRFAEDFILYAKCLMKGAQWWLHPDPMYIYRIRSGSLTEVQTSEDLMRLRQLDQQFLSDPVVQQQPALVSALNRHLRKIDRSYYYRAFTDACKARKPALAASLLFDSTNGFGDIVRESLTQMPTILSKLVQGGYFSSRGKPPQSAAK